MNGVHDLGGMHGFGAVTPEANEPPFHAEWERRAFALTLALGATGRWSIDHSRAARESLPPAQYLASSYYRIWTLGLERLLVARGLLTADELAQGRAAAAPAQVAVLRADDVGPVLARGSPTLRAVAGAPRFAAGERVRARQVNPPTHTRLPRYCRGKPGTITALRGAHVFPDANALDRGEQPHWLYSVRFEARDLWGADTTADAVYVDCWEPCLEAPG